MKPIWLTTCLVLTLLAACPAWAQQNEGQEPARPSLMLEAATLERLHGLAEAQTLPWRELVAWALELEREDAKPQDGPGLALCALVLERLRPSQTARMAKLAAGCLAATVKRPKPMEIGRAAREVGWAALTLDWAYKFLDPGLRRHAAEWMVETAQGFEKAGRDGFSLESAAGLKLFALAGLAAKDLHPQAAELVRQAREERFAKDMLPCLMGAGQGGGWFGGENSGARAGADLAQFVWAMKTATGEDLSDSAPWFADRLGHLAANLLPGVVISPQGRYRQAAPGGDNLYSEEEAADLVRLQMLLLLGLRPEDKAAGLVRALVHERGAAFIEPSRRYQEMVWGVSRLGIAPLATQPLVHVAQGVGRAVSRSDWSELATWLSMDCGPHYTYTQQLGAGGLTIFRQGMLTMAAGGYDGPATPHALNYRIRSLAHNTVVIHDDKEYSWYDMRQGVKAKGTYSNDGGQRDFSVYGAEGKPTLSAPWRSTGWEGGDAAFQKLTDNYKVAGITAHEEQPRYVYFQGEMTAAYQGSTAKAGRVVRHLFHLRAGGPMDYQAAEVIAVLDDVVVARDGLAPRFVLHFPRQPLMVPPLPNKGPGRWQGPARQVVYSEGPSRLEVLGMLPLDGQAWVFGGDQAESWVDGKNYPPKAPAANRAPWRVELGSAKGKGEAQPMLHLLFPAGVKDPAPPDCFMLESPDKRVVAWTIRDPGWPRVVAVRLGKPDAAAAVVYQRPPGKSRHLLAGLVPGAEYAVQVEPGRIIVSSGPGLKSSQAGTLAFVLKPPESPAGGEGQ